MRIVITLFRISDHRLRFGSGLWRVALRTRLWSCGRSREVKLGSVWGVVVRTRRQIDQLITGGTVSVGERRGDQFDHLGIVKSNDAQQHEVRGD